MQALSNKDSSNKVQYMDVTKRFILLVSVYNNRVSKFSLVSYICNSQTEFGISICLEIEMIVFRA